MYSRDEVEAEWEKVKDVHSLFSHYKEKQDYFRFRRLFLKFGFLSGKPKQRTEAKEYYKKWRASNKEKLKHYQKRYWMKKLGESCV